MTRYSIEGNIEGEYEQGGHVLKNKLGIRSKREMDRLEYARLLKTQLHYYRIVKANMRFTNRFICELHQYWLGSIYEWSGKYRTVNLGKSGFFWPPAYLVEKNMFEFEKNFLKKYTPCRPRTINHIAQDLAKVHAELLLIHPFRDGNGRIARLVTILMALQAGYPAPDFAFSVKKNRQRYLMAVSNGYKQDYKLLVAVIQEAIERSKKLLTS